MAVRETKDVCKMEEPASSLGGTPVVCLVSHGNGFCLEYFSVSWVLSNRGGRVSGLGIILLFICSYVFLVLVIKVRMCPFFFNIS